MCKQLSNKMHFFDYSLWDHYVKDLFAMFFSSTAELYYFLHSASVRVHANT